jgi:hypothetical protein
VSQLPPEPEPIFVSSLPLISSDQFNPFNFAPSICYNLAASSQATESDFTFHSDYLQVFGKFFVGLLSRYLSHENFSVSSRLIPVPTLPDYPSTNVFHDRRFPAKFRKREFPAVYPSKRIQGFGFRNLFG